jgi:hypothetical protein
MNKAVVVRLDGRRYLGILYSAPDRKEDNYIILTEVSLVPEADAKSRHIEPLPLVQHLLLRVDEIREMQALKETILRKVDKARLK